jgi:hypothetical protein
MRIMLREDGICHERAMSWLAVAKAVSPASAIPEMQSRVLSRIEKLDRCMLLTLFSIASISS